VEVQERAEAFVAGQLEPEGTFRAGETQRQLTFPTTEHRRKVKFLEAQTQCATQFHSMQADLLERAQAAARARRVGFAVWVQDQWEALGQVKEDATASTSEMGCHARQGFKTSCGGSDRVETGARDSSPVSELDYSDTSEMRVLKVDS